MIGTPFTTVHHGLARAAEARHARRALEQAAEHGVALLEALGLPRLVTPDFTPIDPVAVADAVDRAIAALDEADGDPDMEDEDDDCEPSTDDENTLGWTNAVRQLDLGQATEDGEHTLGAPERGPWVMSLTSPHFEPARGRHLYRCFGGHAHGQAGWAAGARQDGEGEADPGYDLPEGDDERCSSDDIDAEASIGWPEDLSARLDPACADLVDYDRELDPLDAGVRARWARALAASAESRRIAADLARRAKAFRRGPETPLAAIGGNLVPVDLRVIRAFLPPHMDGQRWVGAPVHG